MNGRASYRVHQLKLPRKMQFKRMAAFAEFIASTSWSEQWTLFTKAARVRAGHWTGQTCACWAAWLPIRRVKILQNIHDVSRSDLSTVPAEIGFVSVTWNFKWIPFKLTWTSKASLKTESGAPNPIINFSFPNEKPKIPKNPVTHIIFCSLKC